MRPPPPHGIVAFVASAVKTTLTELGDSRVRLEVEVEAAEVEGRVERKARQLGSQLKLPGFRKGKVPAPLVIQRIGREAILEEAVRDTLSSWYSDAIADAGIVPVGDPTVDIDLGASARPRARRSSSRSRSACCPRPSSASTRGSRSAAPSRRSRSERVEQEVEGMRDRLARLETAERPAAQGDFVVIDYLGSLAGEDGERARAVRRAARGATSWSSSARAT